jgi:hypothetical protein
MRRLCRIQGSGHPQSGKRTRKEVLKTFKRGNAPHQTDFVFTVHYDYVKTT